MNLFLRILWLFLSQKKQELSHWSQTTHVSIKVGFLDLDINAHLTNSRYLAFMDLGRLQLIRSLSFFSLMWKKKWMPVLSTVNCSYIKEIPRGARIDLRTKIIGFDEKYWFIRQQFYVNETLHAQALCRGLFVGPQGKVKPEHILKQHQASSKAIDTQALELPKYIPSWQDFLQEFKKSVQGK